VPICRAMVGTRLGYNWLLHEQLIERMILNRNQRVEHRENFFLVESRLRKRDRITAHGT
jgi:hypothetical protein